MICPETCQMAMTIRIVSTSPYEGNYSGYATSLKNLLV